MSEPKKTARVALPSPSPPPSPPPSSSHPSSPSQQPSEPTEKETEETEDPTAPLSDLDPTTTTSIDLIHTRLSSLPPSLTHFPNLTRLCARQNLLTTLPPHLFPPSGVLEELDLYDNRLTTPSLPPFSLDEFKGLKILDLSFNLLRTIPIPLPPSLEVLYLVQNKITSLPPSPSPFPLTLTSLELGGNRLRSLTALPSLPLLTELWLGKNKLTSLQPLSEISLPNLRILSLQSNRLTSLPPHTIPSSVEELYLSHNGLTRISGLEACTKLSTLDLGNNFIQTIEGISHLGETLEELWINGNRLEGLGEVLGELEGLKRLKTVYLEANPCQKEEGVGYRRKIMLALPWVEQIDATYVR